MLGQKTSGHEFYFLLPCLGGEFRYFLEKKIGEGLVLDLGLREWKKGKTGMEIKIMEDTGQGDKKRKKKPWRKGKT